MIFVNKENELQDIKYDYERLLKAFKTLVESLETYRDHEKMIAPGHKLYQVVSLAVKDSIIIRFSYTFETLWKYVNLYLKQYHGKIVSGDACDVFRACLELHLLSAGDVTVCLEMMNRRRQTVYSENKKVANLVVTKMGDYIAMIEKILKTMRP